MLLWLELHVIRSRETFKRSEMVRLKSEAGALLKEGLKYQDVAAKTGLSKATVWQVKREVVGTRKLQAATRVQGCEEHVRQGKSVTDLLHMGYGVKVARRAYVNVHGKTPGQVRIQRSCDKVAEIKRLILNGIGVNETAAVVKCSAAKVIQEKHALFNEGHVEIKFNKKRKVIT
jgi:hypothetical protein